MTQEQKAKAYDRALKYAMIYYTNGSEDMKIMMKTCFPVLVEESEDERIRKELIDYINRLTASPNNIEKYNTWIAWLEKQGEQKPANSHCSDCTNVKGCVNCTDGDMKETGKPAWSEEDEERLKSCLNTLQAKGIMGVTETINSNWLQSLKQRCAWKPDEWQLKAIKWILDGDNPENWTVTLTNLYNDLKKL